VATIKCQKHFDTHAIMGAFSAHEFFSHVGKLKKVRCGLLITYNIMKMHKIGWMKQCTSWNMKKQIDHMGKYMVNPKIPYILGNDTNEYTCG